MTNNHHSESLTALDYYYYKQEFYTGGCLLALKDIIMSIDSEIIAIRAEVKSWPTRRIPNYKTEDARR
jgi:hypothetical protein